MVPRDHAEPHRQASWLELLFDLAFVVAVAQAAVQLEHAFAEGHPGDGLVGYLIVFAAIWWAWMAFTWFANVFDTDDVPYRLLMFVMIAGSLGLAAGVPQIFELDLRVGVVSYVVMRLAYVAQWLRVHAMGKGEWRAVARRIVLITTVVQIGWVLFLWVPLELRVPVFVAWFAVDIATPWFSGWDARMGGHRHHIVERYGLFTILVLGESIAAATLAVGAAIGARGPTLPLFVFALGGLISVGSLWWIYFDFSTGRAPERGRGAQYAWGYLHYFVFASLAAFGAGLALGVAWLADPAHVALPERGVAMLVGGSVAVLLVTMALIEAAPERNISVFDAVLKLVAAVLTIAAAAAAPAITLSGSMLAVAGVLAALVVYGVVLQHRLHRRQG